MEPTHTLGPRTTAASNAEQRMKVDTGRKRIVRKAVRKAKKKKR